MGRFLFVTGKLAARSLETTLAAMKPRLQYEIAVLPISVAALMSVDFVARHLDGARGCDCVVLPGLCRGDLGVLTAKVGAEARRGPRHLKDIPSSWGRRASLAGYGDHRVKILAEIVDAHALPLEAVLERATYFRDSGADIIDIGCPAGESFPGVERVIRELKAGGFRVSLDTGNPDDMLRADRAGVDLLLSVNARNLDVARRVRCPVVVIPDFEGGMESLERNIARVAAWGRPYVIDPVLKPVGLGLAESIEAYVSLRRRYPRAEMLMGIGNVTELMDADSTGVTALMTGILTELRIDYALTTEEISWARGAVRELDLARRLMYYACRNRTPPKHLHDGLITVKDPPFEPYGEEELRSMQAKVRDRNFRIFCDRESIYVFNNRLFVKGGDIQSIFDRLGKLEPAEAFYLGVEFGKASLAVRLGKKYVQEEPLRWGYLSESGSPDGSRRPGGEGA